ncbi:MAG: hypothetical protein ABIJ12_02065 [bacterium]
MKKITVLFGLTFLAVLWLGAQEIKVLDTVIIPTEQNNYTAPQFSPDGEKILFTQFGFKGLWLYDLSKKSLSQINDYTGAGYEPVFTADGKQLVFRIDEYVKMRKYSTLAIQTIGDKKIEYLTEKMRYLSPATLVNNIMLVFRENKAVKVINASNNEKIQSSVIHETYGYIEKQNIVLLINGERKELRPIDNGDYIWFSLSPDKTKMVFTVVGGSTYIADTEGNILTMLGRANAPKWSPDGKWILYMIDEDDGHVVISSDIWAARVDGKTRIQLTKTNDIHEMYPAWSPSRDKIVYETNSGQIVFMNISITD